MLTHLAVSFSSLRSFPVDCQTSNALSPPRCWPLGYTAGQDHQRFSCRWCGRSERGAEDRTTPGREETAPSAYDGSTEWGVDTAVTRSFRAATMPFSTAASCE